MKKILFAALAALVPLPALAVDKIYTPYIEKGEIELEYSGSRTFDGDSSKDNAQGHAFDVGYSPTNFWQVELSAGFEKEPRERTRFTEWEIENRFQLAEPGEYWLDPGVLVSYIHTPNHAAADAIEAKLLLAKDVGKFSTIANLGLEQEVGAHSSGGPERSLIVNSRYRLNPYFEPGLELQSEFGKPNENLSYDEQEHYFGPAAFGSLGHNIKYQAAYLFGISDAAADGALRLLVEYELYF